MGVLSSCNGGNEFNDPEVDVKYRESFDDIGEKVDEETSKSLKAAFTKKQEEKATIYRRYYSNFSKDELNLDIETKAKGHDIFRIYDDYFFIDENSGSAINEEKEVETKYDYSSTSYNLYHSKNDLYLEVAEYAIDDEVRFFVNDLSKEDEDKKEAAKKEVYQNATKNLTGYIRYDNKLDFYESKDGNGYIYIYNHVYEYSSYSDETKKYSTTTQQYIHFNEEYEVILETYYYIYTRNYSSYTGEKYADFITFAETKAYSYASYGDRVVDTDRFNELVAKYDKRRIHNAYVEITNIKYEDGTDCDISGYLPYYGYKDRELKTFECSTTWKLRDLHIGEVHKIRYNLDVYIYDGLFDSDFELHVLLPDLKVKEGYESYFAFDSENSILEFTPTKEEQDIKFSAILSLDENGDVEVKSASIELGD